MSQDFFDDVGKFHEKMGLPVSDGDGVLFIPPEQFNFRVNFIFEELRELIQAYSVDDPVAVADALVDLVYVALGTAHYFNLPFNRLWDEVHRSNMEKRRWQPGDPIKPRAAASLDVVKPDGWTPPDLVKVLFDHGS